MSLIDRTVEDLVAQGLPDVAKANYEENRLGYKQQLQQRVNRLADTIVQYVRNNLDSSSNQLKIPYCIFATQHEMNALCANLFQRYRILASVYTKSYTETIQNTTTTGFNQHAQNNTRTIGHECTKQLIEFSELLGWSSQGGECWSLTLNWFTLGQSPMFMVDPSTWQFPVGLIMSDIDIYVEKIGDQNPIIRRYAPYWSTYVQLQIQHYATMLHQGFMQTPSSDAKFLLQTCIRATELEMKILVIFLMQQFNVMVVPKIPDHHAHDPNTNPPFNLAEKLGQLHPGRRLNCYWLEFHRPVSATAPLPELLMPRTNPLQIAYAPMS